MVALPPSVLTSVIGGLGAKRSPALGPSHLTSSAGKAGTLAEAVNLGTLSRTAPAPK
jgi:hypothetical protein